MKKLLNDALSIVLVFMLMFSIASVGVNAVETPDNNRGNSPNTFSFDVAKSYWKNFNFVYCHIFTLDGSKIFADWQSKTEMCDYNAETGIASYNLDKLKDKINKTDGKIYGVIFSTDTGYESDVLITNGACIGDVAVCTQDSIFSPTDSVHSICFGYWRDNVYCGSEKKFFGTELIGCALPQGKTDEMLLAEHLITYYNDSYVMDKVQVYIDTLQVNVTDVKNQLKAKIDLSDERFTKIMAVLDKCVDCEVTPVYGDCNWDNELSIDDVTNILKYIAGKFDYETFGVRDYGKILDVNRDGIANVKDATAVQKRIAGIL